MAEYGNGEGVTQSPPLQTAVDTEQFRNVQESERYSIHVSGTKSIKYTCRYRTVPYSVYSILCKVLM